MMGQVDALKRVGISFSEAEANVIKYGTEQEKAAMLAQVIQNNVGDMNAELAKTDSGKQQQLVNTLGDMKEELGAMVNGALPLLLSRRRPLLRWPVLLLWWQALKPYLLRCMRPLKPF